MKMSSESSYDQFNDLNYHLHHSYSNSKKQQQQLQMFTYSPSAKNVPCSSISSIPSKLRQSYPILLDPSPALIMKPKVTLPSVNLYSTTSESCLPTITRTGREKMSPDCEPKLMTFQVSTKMVQKEESQRKHALSLSSSSSPSLHHSAYSNQCLSSFPTNRYRRSFDKRSRCSRRMLTSCNLLLVILLYYLIQTCNCECEKMFDAVFCDLPDSYSNGAKTSNNRLSNSNQEQPSALPFLSTSVTSGYGFKSGKIWKLECVSSDEINVLKNSMKEFDFPYKDNYGQSNVLSAAISDGETYYFIQNYMVYTTNESESGGPDLYKLNTPKGLHSIFDDYKGVVRTGFHFRSKLYLFDGSVFHIYTQKSFRKSGPFWSWSKSEDTNSRLKIPVAEENDKNSKYPKGNLTSVFTVKSAEAAGEIDIILIYDHIKYFKLSLNKCLMELGNGSEFFHEDCFWKKGPNDTDNLFDCIWISWQVLAAIITVCLVSLLVIGYCCFCIICYRKKRRSGTFRHEKQSCCPDSDQSDLCDVEQEPLKKSLSLQVECGDGLVDGVDGCGRKSCRDGLSLLPGGPNLLAAVNGNGGLSNGSLHHHHHHHIVEYGEKEALYNPSDLDVESETGSTVGVACYNEDRLSINLEESKFGKYGPSINGAVYNSTTTTRSTSQSNLTSQYHHHHINMSNGSIVKNNGI